MTAADRPSVTDNARAEAMARELLVQTLTANPDEAASESSWEWARRIVGRLLDAGRAETTTATTECVIDQAREVIDAARLRHHRDIDPAEAALDLDAAGLLATARTRPTREQIARALAKGYETGQPEPNLHDYRAADAVRALLTDQPTEGTRWWVPAYRTPEPNSRVQLLGSPTVLREYAEREVEQYRKQEAEDPKGNPDAIFLATRVEHPWTEADRG